MVSISNSCGCDITCTGGFAAIRCHYGMYCVKCTVGDRKTHGSYRYGMLTCSIRGMSYPSTIGIIVLTFCGRWYAEDGSRLPGLDVLKEVGQLFATSIVSYSCIHARFIYTILSQPDLPGILDSSPVDARIQGWKTKTQREFDPLEDARTQTSKTILCPTCRNPINASQSRL
jgi:hypothetical protein